MIECLPACGRFARWRGLAWAALCLFALFTVAAPAGAQDTRPVPALTARVIDQTGSLGAQRDVLEAKLAAFEAASGPQIVILMVASTQPEDLTSYAYRVADAWKIGRREVGDGVLVVVAKDDRKVRIEVAKALEGAVPDLAARQIIDRAITPAFRAGDYAGGLSSAIDLLEARIRGEHLPAPTNDARPGGAANSGADGGWGQLVVMLLIGVVVVGRVLRAMLGRTLGSIAAGVGVGVLAWVLGAGLVFAILGGVVAIVVAAVSGLGASATAIGGGRHFGTGMLIGSLLGSGLGRGGGGGGGGGGFSSGRGGDFGGGGASGGW